VTSNRIYSHLSLSRFLFLSLLQTPLLQSSHCLCTLALATYRCLASLELPCPALAALPCAGMPFPASAPPSLPFPEPPSAPPLPLGACSCLSTNLLPCCLPRHLRSKT